MMAFFLRVGYFDPVHPKPPENASGQNAGKLTAGTISLDGGGQVSRLDHSVANPRACYVLAHGAGAGMTHRFMVDAANGLAERGINTLRYQFPYMENRQPRPDPPPVARGTVRAAVAEAARQFPRLPLFAGGKSFGGRMTSQAQGEAPMPGVRGLVFFGFPLHPPGRPSLERAEHLFDVEIPMLFLQGTRDEFADAALLNQVIERLGSRATLHSVAEANHSFHVPKRAGRTDSEIMAEALDAIAKWVQAVLGLAQ